MSTLLLLAEQQRSQEVTDWAARIGWVVGLLLFVALLYWLMRQGWKWRATLQGDLPPLAPVPEDPGTPTLRLTGRYHGSTGAGQWLDRIVAHDLGIRSRVELALTEEGVRVVRPGSRDFLIPRDRLRGARLDTGIAGKVVTEGGLLVLTWSHGDRTLDSGFRSDRAAEHGAWVTAVEEIARSQGRDVKEPAGDSDVATPHKQEGAT
ncbi:hypothetical protein [Streptomyces sp. NPDC005438]|uniref:PH-like domain-containing protein n=1 Tax=Streptomyces sp. NPDC005438 TaxID=3156880 RepID=UPI0033ADFA43